MKPPMMYVHGAGVAAPGLEDWQSAQPILLGSAPYSATELPAYRPSLLPRNEARRAGAAVRLAFRAAEQACDAASAAEHATVFASASGDIDIADRITSDLVDPEGAVSPTQFHNSVHNAAAGYWSIATGSRQPANSISAHRDSFALALRECWAWLLCEDAPVLLVCFELDGGGMLEQARTAVGGPCALALRLSREPEGALAALTAPVLSEKPATRMADAGLEALRQVNCAARGLPLLRALAAAPAEAEVVIESGQGNILCRCHPPNS